jgi:hypothetical protein
MSARLELTGQRFGRLVALSFSHVRKKHAWWIFRCDCGSEVIAAATLAIEGQKRSCGCLKREHPNNLRHGHSAKNWQSRTYQSWGRMKERCTNPKNNRFKNYGGRNITFCERWKVFDNFYSDMGERPPDTTLDRIDNDGNYEPGNCRWANKEIQSRSASEAGKKGAIARWGHHLKPSPS